MSRLRIVADENIAQASDYFSAFGDLRLLPGRAIDAKAIADADLLLVRSVTQVNERLLGNSPVQFVGTCTIGTDHIDLDYLARAGIGFSAAPGCNADAVVDYVLAALAQLGLAEDLCWWDKTVGIVGLGNVGGRLSARLQAMGVSAVACDPPLERAGRSGLLSLDELLSQADIISIHTPLTRSGKDATWHMLNQQNLGRLKPGAVLINSARGPIVDNQALLHFAQERPDVRLVLDVWESEPIISTALLDKVALATPHIAGYSLEGKIRGTQMVYEAVCAHWSIEPVRLNELTLPKPSVCDRPAEKAWDNLNSWIQQAYAIAEDDRSLRQAILGATGVGACFDGLRRDYSVRREFCATQFSHAPPNDVLRERLAALGFAFNNR